MIKTKSYIASPKYLKDMYHNPSLNSAFKTVDKISIRKIKIDKSLFAYQNEVNKKDVDYMVNNFYRGAWFPVMINQNFFLIDGQHRIAAAKRMKLKYIDVVIETTDFRKVNRSKGNRQ